jgi:hypothetical protein
MDAQALNDLYDSTNVNPLLREFAAFRPATMNPQTIELARNKCKRRELTLVIGAGVSKSVGIPDWNEMVQRLAADTYGALGKETRDRLIDLLKSGALQNTVLVRHLEQQLQFKSALKNRLRHRLYDGVDTEAFSKLLLPLCRYFLLPDLESRISSVICYNFDSLLERALKSLGCDPKPIYSHATYLEGSSPLAIYHPHGFLPHFSDYDGDVDHPLVFSEPDYHAHYLDMGHWANVLQLHHFMHRSCLFVGVSLNDPNMRRLLDFARRQSNELRHFAIQTVKPDAFQSAFIEHDHYSLGLRVIWVDSRENIPAVLEALTH